MTSRFTPVLALALLGAGIVTGVLGLLGNSDDQTAYGIFLAVTALPLIITRTLRNTLRIGAHQLAAADNAGYRRALDHVARGLLDQHTSPPRGGHPAEPEQATGNVITLRPDTDDRTEWEAQ
ncbi:hypothetical protein [Streptomyces sp. BPTC-684]|uniref:hypothetical protein n=1 Tax=Streptomyces sp. BPTC-684 TaxID=3043734 RepID=UPI0024B0F8EE|nr:hypothetical protein [Streptomyces sp. BPTC-684]WHM36284.1 hypothetical protein QIY60_04640 [Streptomyces sp. BPTC-684]